MVESRLSDSSYQADNPPSVLSASEFVALENNLPMLLVFFKSLPSRM